MVDRINNDLSPELAERLGFETLIARLSSNFVNLPSWKVDSEIENSMRSVCEFLGIELAAFWQWSQEESDKLIMTHLYRPLGGPEIPEQMEASTYFPWIFKEMRAGRTIALSSADEAPAEAARDMESWNYFGIKTCLALPLAVGEGELIGVISFNTMTEERDWPKNIVRRLNLVGEMFSNAIARKRSDEMLRESEERLSLAADSAGAGLWSLNLATGIFWLTDRTRDLFGLPPDETVTQERFISLIHPEDREAMIRGIREVAEDTDRPVDQGGIEYRIIRTDGKVRWLFSKGRISPNSSGGQASLTGVSIDITERKLVDEKARAFSGRLINAYEEERARLARELHDDLTQRLARMAIDVARLEQDLPSLALRGRIAALQEDLVSLSEDVHTLSYRLHPSLLEDLGLAEAIRTECERVSELESRPISIEIEEECRPASKDVALCLFRITQEALRNAIRYAGECEIIVSLRCLKTHAELSIRDNGSGFDMEHARSGHTLGLTGMRERTQLVGGSIVIESEPGAGTSVLVTVPVEGKK